VPRPKPSAWKSVGLDEVKTEILRLYPDEKLNDSIKEHLGSGSDAREEQLRQRLRGSLCAVWIGLHQRQRTPWQKAGVSMQTYKRLKKRGLLRDE
jgi:hypothetical protein